MTSHFKYLALLSLVALIGCGGGDGLPRAPIAGLVTVGGQPLKSGRIIFTPIAPNEGPATSAVVVDGKYEIPRQEGPVAGHNRVAVEADLDLGFAIDDEAAFAARGGRPLPPSPIPSAFGQNSQLTCEVKLDDKNNFDVIIPAVQHTVARPRY